MSISPASDIVLDVARAADPSQARAATERLAKIASGGEASPDAFATTLTTTKPDPSDPRRQIMLLGVKSASRQPSGDAGTNPYRGLEELFLQKLVETMLPKEAAALFGEGTAGDIWRSMLAGELAKSLGKTIDLGLAKSALPRSRPISPADHAAAETGGVPRDIPIDNKA